MCIRDRLEEIYDEIYPVISLYNLVRNYVTQKPYSTKKIKLNFGIVPIKNHGNIMHNR